MCLQNFKLELTPPNLLARTPGRRMTDNSVERGFFQRLRRRVRSCSSCFERGDLLVSSPNLAGNGQSIFEYEHGRSHVFSSQTDESGP